MKYNIISVDLKMLLDYKLPAKLVREARRKWVCAQDYEKIIGNRKENL